MPAETHQRGGNADPEEVVVLLFALLGDRVPDAPEEITLASLGVDEYALGDLWDAVREEFGERTLGPTDLEEVLDPSLTVEAAAAAMARLLGGDRHGRADVEGGSRSDGTTGQAPR